MNRLNRLTGAGKWQRRTARRSLCGGGGGGGGGSVNWWAVAWLEWRSTIGQVRSDHNGESIESERKSRPAFFSPLMLPFDLSLFFFFASWLGGYKKMTAAREWRTNIVDRRRLAGDEDPSLHLGRRGRRNRKCRHLSGAVLHSSWRGTKLVACRDGAILLRCGTHTAGQSAFWTSLRSIVWAFCWPERTDTDRPHSREVS